MKIIAIENNTATIQLDAQECADLSRDLRTTADNSDGRTLNNNALMASIFELLTLAVSTCYYTRPGDEWTLAMARDQYQLPS